MHPLQLLALTPIFRPIFGTDFLDSTFACSLLPLAKGQESGYKRGMSKEHDEPITFQGVDPDHEGSFQGSAIPTHEDLKHLAMMVTSGGAAIYVGKRVVDATIDVAKHAAIKAIDARAARNEPPPTIYGGDGRPVTAKDRK